MLHTPFSCTFFYSFSFKFLLDLQFLFVAHYVFKLNCSILNFSTFCKNFKLRYSSYFCNNIAYNDISQKYIINFPKEWKEIPISNLSAHLMSAILSIHSTWKTSTNETLNLKTTSNLSYILENEKYHVAKTSICRKVNYQHQFTILSLDVNKLLWVTKVFQGTFFSSIILNVTTDCSHLHL